MRRQGSDGMGRLPGRMPQGPAESSGAAEAKRPIAAFHRRDPQSTASATQAPAEAGSRSARQMALPCLGLFPAQPARFLTPGQRGWWRRALTADTWGHRQGFCVGAGPGTPEPAAPRKAGHRCWNGAVWVERRSGPHLALATRLQGPVGTFPPK